jgi:hypothetical protein
VRSDSLCRASAAITVVFAIALSGCGKPTLYPVSGTVKVDGKPASGVRVFVWRNGEANASAGTQIGMGFSGPDGKFSVSCGTSEEGLERGSYRVTLSRPMTKGKPMVAGEKPSGAVEVIPKPYSDHETPSNSPLLVSVPASDDLVIEVPPGLK